MHLKLLGVHVQPTKKLLTVAPDIWWPIDFHRGLIPLGVYGGHGVASPLHRIFARLDEAALLRQAGQRKVRFVTALKLMMRINLVE